MIDERSLTDPSRCPSCTAVLDASPRCGTCGVDVRGTTAAEVWTVSLQVAALLGRRRELVARLRAEAAPRPAVPAAAADAWTSPAVAQKPSQPVTAGRSASESSTRSVQNVLLGLGVLLLAVAAVIFLVVSWGRLGVGGRAAVMAGCTVVAAVGAATAYRRGLGATAEAVAVLTVGLGILDAYGARRTGLLGLDGTSALTYWAGALTVIAAAAAVGARLLPLRAWRLAAALLGQLPAPLLAAYWADGADTPAAVVAVVLTVQTVVVLAVSSGRPLGRLPSDVRPVLWAGSLVAGVAGAAAAGWAAYDDGPVVVGVLALLVLAGAAVAAVRLAGAVPDGGGSLPLAEVGLGAAAVLAVAAVWAPPVDLLGRTWLPVALSVLAGGLIVTQLAVPSSWRGPQVLVFLLAAVTPGVVAGEAVRSTVVAPLGWLDQAWTESSAGSARSLLEPFPSWAPGDWPGEVSTPVLLAAVAVALLAASRVTATLAAAARGALPVLVLAVVTAPAAWDLSFRAGLALDCALALLLLVGPTLLPSRLAAPAWVVSSSLILGAALLALAVSWSFASATTTLAVLPASAGVLAVVAWRHRAAPGRAPVGRTATGASALLLVAEAAAVARYHGAGWPAVWSLALTLAAAAAVVGALLLRGTSRHLASAAASGLACADAAAVTLWAGGAAPAAGLAATVAGALVVAASCQTVVPAGSRAGDSEWRLLQRVVGSVAIGLGVTVSAQDPDQLWLALLAAGVAVAIAGVFGVGAPYTGWLAGLVLASSSWVRLALSDVEAPEAYTAPAGLALLVMGELQRRRDPTYRSWVAYGPGLSLVLVPSLVRAVTDAGTLRPLALGLVASAVLAVGVVRRLQAPLVLGGLVLAVDAVVQLSPFLVDLYDAVPRWTVIGAVGLALLVLGATYERRIRELRVLQTHLSAFG